MNHKTHLYTKLYCPRYTLLFPESNKESKYILTNPNYGKHSIQTKTIFKKEKCKIKESVFNLVHNIKKNQIKREHKTIDINKNKINKCIEILDDANIDEGIVLNQYFAYMKRYNIEHEKSQKMKLKNFLIPIKNQEKMIKNIKKNINFFKSISNHMLMKYMIENKEKLNQYMDEISPNKTRNSISYSHNNKKRYSTEKSISLTKQNYDKNILKTFSNYDDIRNNKNSINGKSSNYFNRKTVSNLKLKIGDSLILRNKKSLSPFSTGKMKIKNNKRFSVTINSNRHSIKLNNQYYTPSARKKFSQNLFENNKNNEIITNRSDYKTSISKFNSSLKTKKD